MQRRRGFDGDDRRAHDLLDGSSGDRFKRFGQELTIPEQLQPPVAPGNPIGVVATQQIAFADHSNQLLVGGEHGNGAYAFLE
jgi:hypothetical protein